MSSSSASDGPVDTTPTAPDTAPQPPVSPEREARFRIMAGQRDGMPPLTEPQLRAVQGSLSDTDAIARGTATSASEVLDETASALVRIDALAVVSAHARPMRYAKFRVRYIFDLLFALRDEVEDQTARTHEWILAQDRLVRQLNRARDDRNSVLDGFNRIVRLHPEHAQEVANQRGTSDHAPEVAASLASLASLLDAWAADPDKAALLESVGMDGIAEATRTRSVELEAARQAVHEFPASRRDRPGTNLLEGRLMTELHELYRALEQGQGTIPGLPRLPLGNTLRRAFGRISGVAIPEDPTLDKPLAPPAGDPPSDPASDPAAI